MDRAKGLPVIKRFTNPPPLVPVLRLGGVIGPSGRLRPGLNLESIAPQIERAFSFKDAPAVALIINSPGGSPVQSGFIYKRIRDLAAEKEKKVFAFCEDVVASGGYMLALSADEIYVHEASIIGSIGVISAGFGFPEAIKKLGIERRVYTAGESKSMLDPFKPEKEEDVERLLSIQKEVHEYFKSLVRERRGDKLKTPRKQLFSGEFWAGEQAVRTGLVDGVADIRAKMRELYGDKVRLRVIEAPKRLFPRPSAVMQHAVHAAVDTLEERAHWSRFGL